MDAQAGMFIPRMQTLAHTYLHPCARIRTQWRTICTNNTHAWLISVSSVSSISGASEGPPHAGVEQVRAERAAVALREEGGRWVRRWWWRRLEIVRSDAHAASLLQLDSIAIGRDVIIGDCAHRAVELLCALQAVDDDGGAH